MADGLGTIVILNRANAVGPVFHLRCSLIGDADYDAGGSAGLLAALKALLGDDGISIVSFVGSSPPASVAEVEYDFANDKVFCRVRTTGVESADADMSAITYNFNVVLA